MLYYRLYSTAIWLFANLHFCLNFLMLMYEKVLKKKLLMLNLLNKTYYHSYTM